MNALYLSATCNSVIFFKILNCIDLSCKPKSECAQNQHKHNCNKAGTGAPNLEILWGLSRDKC